MKLLLIALFSVFYHFNTYACDDAVLKQKALDIEKELNPNLELVFTGMDYYTYSKKTRSSKYAYTVSLEHAKIKTPYEIRYTFDVIKKNCGVTNVDRSLSPTYTNEAFDILTKNHIGVNVPPGDVLFNF